MRVERVAEVGRALGKLQGEFADRPVKVLPSFLVNVLPAAVISSFRTQPNGAGNICAAGKELFDRRHSLPRAWVGIAGGQPLGTQELILGIAAGIGKIGEDRCPVLVQLCGEVIPERWWPDLPGEVEQIVLGLLQFREWMSAVVEGLE